MMLALVLVLCVCAYLVAKDLFGLDAAGFVKGLALKAWGFVSGLFAKKA